MDELLEELRALAGRNEELRKSLSADKEDDKRDEEGDGKKVKQAAKDGNPDADGDGKDDVTGNNVPTEADIDDPDVGELNFADDGDDDGDEDDKDSLTKSLAAGVNADLLLKSLAHHIDERLGASLGTVSALLKSQQSLIEDQANLIKSLQEKIDRLANSGRGRSSKVTPDASMLKSQTVSLTAEQFFAKAMDALKCGAITSRDIAMAESAINGGGKVPDELVRRVIQSSTK